MWNQRFLSFLFFIFFVMPILFPADNVLLCGKSVSLPWKFAFSQKIPTLECQDRVDGSAASSDPDLEMVHELVLGMQDVQQVVAGLGVHPVDHLLEGCLLVLNKHALGCGADSNRHPRWESPPHTKQTNWERISDVIWQDGNWMVVLQKGVQI